MDGGGGEEGKRRPTIFRDIRRYYCDYCGISRSKKSLLNSHLLSHHKEEVERKEEKEQDERKANTCEQCGATFRKPAYLKQHMQSHLIEIVSFLIFRKPNQMVLLWREALDPIQRTPKCKERPFVCSVDDCYSSYRRKDHLTRHLLQHQGKLFTCPIEGCNHKFAYQGNMKRHVVELHDEVESASCSNDSRKKHVCPEVGCGKVFEFASKLRKHEESHVKLDSVEAICCEPGCMKSFTNSECLKAHLRSCHQYIPCEVCGTKQLKKNIKRHMQIHENGCTVEKFKCSVEGCLHTFATKSNLNQHIKAVHLELRPFACQFAGCGKRFTYKHVRDNHEKTGLHVYVQGDFMEADEQFRSRPRGGRKRKCPTVDMLLRKRVMVPGLVDSATSHGSGYLSWLLTASDND